ncbi:FAD-binding oxidoreductase [Microbacterium halophytorum]|uniref:FAD-binding oxidoreductase n=1 Tax=Microbacterium halophytorum TaxID=2067568 RepID=UPI000CFBB381|nr:FAD-linked oxidase C-terminal domain-containing protein [Microbacterium halophytorum]
MSLVARLERAVPGRVVSDPVGLAPYTADRSGHRAAGRPIAAVEPETVEEVQEVCRIASAEGVPVVTRGAGTGLAGGAIAGPGELVVSLMRMDRILEVSRENRLAVVQPGILNAALNAELAQYGLWWAPDPASRDISTVGGNIAMNAGGLLCAKYGVTREAVLALKVVLIDGRVIDVGHRTVKGVTGYDLCALMIGSEGTLGIVVEATLKLVPIVTGEPVTIGAFFDRLDDAAGAAAEISRRGLVPAILELLDRPSLDCVAAYTGERLNETADAYVLAQCDGPDAERTGAGVAQALREAGGDVRSTTDPAESERLWSLRRNVFPAVEAASGGLLVEDIAVPRDRMVDAFAAIRSIERRYEVSIPTGCHAGDGNLHPVFSYDDGGAVPDRIWEAAGEVFQTALDLGGTLSGEHGIGLLKRRWLADELGDAQFELQRGVKELFDPRGLLNPGKVFAV